MLLYKLNKRAKVMDLYHTEVPIEHRGKGIGGILVKVNIRISFRL